MLAGNVGVPSGNTYGSAAFISSLASGPAIVLTQQSIGRAPINRIAVRRDDVAIDTAKWFTFRDPVMNAEDAAAWIGKLSGATIANDEVIGFTTATGAPTVIAREGSSAPGTNAIFSSFKSVALPDGALGPIFSASLLPGASGASILNDTGLWATTSSGELMLICRTGNAFAGRIITKFSAIDYVAGSPGQSRSFNTTRDLVLSLVFQDGSQSVVRVTIP